MSGGLEIRLAIEGWSAWTDHAAFAGNWIELLSLPPGREAGKVADVSHLPPGTRRRLKPMARSVLYTAMQAIGTAAWSEVPLILFSEHGETHRGLNIMTDMANGEPVSPTEFSHSVHNAVAGQLSILTGDPCPVIAMADSGEGIASALLEAHLLLATADYRQAMVIFYDEPLPALYASYADSPCALLALAVLVGNDGSGRLIRARRCAERGWEGEASWRQLIRLAHCLDTNSTAVAMNHGNRWELDIDTHER